MFLKSDSNSAKKKTDSIQAIHTLLGKDTTWKGEIHSGPSSVRVEGIVEGSIHSEGEVTIAPTGRLIGAIYAKHLVVTGRVEGVFRITECLEIREKGWVEGEVEVGSLVVDEGGTLLGTCTRHGVQPNKDALELKIQAKPDPKADWKLDIMTTPEYTPEDTHTPPSHETEAQPVSDSQPMTTTEPETEHPDTTTPNQD